MRASRFTLLSAALFASSASATTIAASDYEMCAVGKTVAVETVGAAPLDLRVALAGERSLVAWREPSGQLAVAQFNELRRVGKTIRPANERVERIEFAGKVGDAIVVLTRPSACKNCLHAFRASKGEFSATPVVISTSAVPQGVSSDDKVVLFVDANAVVRVTPDLAVSRQPFSLKLPTEPVVRFATFGDSWAVVARHESNWVVVRSNGEEQVYKQDLSGPWSVALRDDFEVVIGQRALRNDLILGRDGAVRTFDGHHEVDQLLGAVLNRDPDFVFVLWTTYSGVRPGELRLRRSPAPPEGAAVGDVAQNRGQFLVVTSSGTKGALAITPVNCGR